MQQNKTCPCCGGKITAALEVEALKSLPFSNMKTRIIEAYVDAYPRPMTMHHLVERVYEVDPDGGPELADRSVASTLTRLRPEIAIYGWTISKFKGNDRGDNLSRLEPIGD